MSMAVLLLARSPRPSPIYWDSPIHIVGTRSCALPHHGDTRRRFIHLYPLCAVIRPDLVCGCYRDSGGKDNKICKASLTTGASL